MPSPVLDRYAETLRNLPPPGVGANCHGRIMAAANYGVMAGLPPERIHDDLLHAIPPGKRRLPSNEIPDAIKRALSDFNGGSFIPRPRSKPIVQDGKKALQGIIDQGEFGDEADLWESSPIRIDWLPAEDVHHAF
ncbi:MAG: hypothetical protein NT140_01325 [Deltaproteobacteria bacterium]|nr:hypothetical protein [Deltaproteobacteria bacterium]